VPRKRGSSLSQAIVDKFKTADRMQLAVTPEGTRSRVSEWRRGFLYIARDANVPIVLGVLDAATKTMTIDTTYFSVGDIDEDMKAIKRFYRASGAIGIKPQNFTTD
jgi:1-acyl-sn-glycerol-3-phosphate acyltransferase